MQDDAIDKNLIKSIANYYKNVVSGDATTFENSLIDYFKLHYKDLSEDKYKTFLYKFSCEGAENIEEGDLFKIARRFEINTDKFKIKFVYMFFINNV